MLCVCFVLWPCDFFAPFQDQCTPMHVAAENGEVGAIEALKKAGADVDARDLVSAAGEKEDGGEGRGREGTDGGVGRVGVAPSPSVVLYCPPPSSAMLLPPIELCRV